MATTADLVRYDECRLVRLAGTRGRMINRERPRRDENRAELSAHLGQLIFDPQGLSNVFDAHDKTVIGKLAQMLRQNLLRNAAQVTFQLQRTQGTVGE